MMDKRIWIPDETCTPFYLNTTYAAANNVALFQFRMPDDQYGVIKRVTLFTNAAAMVNKSVAKLILRDGQGGAITINQLGKSFTGVLMAREIDGVLPNVAGIGAINFAAIPQEITIQLEPGNAYEIDYVASVASTIFVAISGWSFPRTLQGV